MENAPAKKNYPKKSQLSEHIKRVHPTEVNIIYSKICNRKFIKLIYLDIHMK